MNPYKIDVKNLKEIPIKTTPITIMPSTPCGEINNPIVNLWIIF